MRCVKELKGNVEKSSDKTMINSLKKEKKRKDQKDFKIMFLVDEITHRDTHTNIQYTYIQTHRV